MLFRSPKPVAPSWATCSVSEPYLCATSTSVPSIRVSSHGRSCAVSRSVCYQGVPGGRSLFRTMPGGNRHCVPVLARRSRLRCSRQQEPPRTSIVAPNAQERRQTDRLHGRDTAGLSDRQARPESVDHSAPTDGGLPVRLRAYLDPREPGDHHAGQSLRVADQADPWQERRKRNLRFDQ